MEVVRFSDQYDKIAALHGRSPAELRSRDEAREEPVLRWLAIDGTLLVGTATASLRPDQRRFLSFTGETRAIGPLVERAATHTGADLYASTDQPEQLAVLQHAGFELEVASEEFEVRFDTVLATLQRAQMPEGWSAAPAGTVDPQRLFALDNTIRSGIRGMEGWQGNWGWFRGELDDPSAYLVAVGDETAEYAGLARIWRNPSGPRFGLVGVAAGHRGTRIGPGLLQLVLEDAAGWGHDTFTAETGVENRHFHRRLRKLGAASRGIRHQMVLKR